MNDDVEALGERVLMEVLADKAQKFLRDVEVPEAKPQHHVMHLAFVAGFASGLRSMNVPTEVIDRVGKLEIMRYGEGPDE